MMAASVTNSAQDASATSAPSVDMSSAANSVGTDGSTTAASGPTDLPGIKPTSTTGVLAPPLTKPGAPGPGSIQSSYDTDSSQFPMQQATKQLPSNTTPLSTTEQATLPLGSTSGTSSNSHSATQVTSSGISNSDNTNNLLPSATDSAGDSSDSVSRSQSDSISTAYDPSVTDTNSATSFDSDSTVDSVDITSSVVGGSNLKPSVPPVRIVPTSSADYQPSTGEVVKPITASKTVYTSSAAVPLDSFKTTPVMPITPSVKPVKPSTSGQSTILGGGLPDYILYIGIPLCGIVLLIFLIVCIICIRSRKNKNKGSPAKNHVQDLWVNSQPEISLTSRRPLLEANGGERIGGHKDLGCTTYEAVFDFPAELDTHITLHQGDNVTVHRKENNGWWRGTIGERSGWFPCSYVQAAPQDKLETENEVEMHSESNLSSFMVARRPESSYRDSYPTEEEIGAEPIYCKIQPKDKRKSEPRLGDKASLKVADVTPPKVASKTPPKTMGQMINRDNTPTPLEEGSRFVSVYSYAGHFHGELTMNVGDIIIGREQDRNGWMNGYNLSSKEDGWFPAVYVEKMVKEEEAEPELTPDPSSYKHLEVNTSSDSGQHWVGIEHRALHDFRAEKAGDLEFNEGDHITVFQVLENGWWLGCKDKVVGWFPGSFVEMIDFPSPSPKKTAAPPIPPVKPPSLESNPPAEPTTPQKKSKLRPARKAPPPPPKANNTAVPETKIPSPTGSKLPKKKEIPPPVPPVRIESSTQNDSYMKSTNMADSEPQLLTSDGLYELIPNPVQKPESTKGKAKDNKKPKIPVRYIKPKLVKVPKHEVEMPNINGYNRDSMSCELSPPRPPGVHTDTDPVVPSSELSHDKYRELEDPLQSESEDGFFHLKPQQKFSDILRQDSGDVEPDLMPYTGMSSFGSTFGKREDRLPVSNDLQGWQNGAYSPTLDFQDINIPQSSSQEKFVQDEKKIDMDNFEFDIGREALRVIGDLNDLVPDEPIEIKKDNEPEVSEVVPKSKVPTSPKAKDKPTSRLPPPKQIALGTSGPNKNEKSGSLSPEDPKLKTPVTKIPKPGEGIKTPSTPKESSNKPSPVNQQALKDENVITDSKNDNDIVSEVVTNETPAYNNNTHFGTNENFENFINQDDGLDDVRPRAESFDRPPVAPKPKSKGIPKPPSKLVADVKQPDTNMNEIKEETKPVSKTPDSGPADALPPTPVTDRKRTESENETDSKTKEKPKISKLPLGSKIAQKSPQLRGRKSKIPASPGLRTKSTERQDGQLSVRKTSESDSDAPLSPATNLKQKPESLKLSGKSSPHIEEENKTNLRNRSNSPHEKRRGIPTTVKQRSNSPAPSRLAKPISVSSPGSPATPTGKSSGLVPPKKLQNGHPGRQSPANDLDSPRSQATPSPEIPDGQEIENLSPKPERPNKPPRIQKQKSQDGRPPKGGKSLLPLIHKSMDAGSPTTGSKIPKRGGIPVAKPPRPPPPKSPTDDEDSNKKSLYQAVRGYTAQSEEELSFSEGTFIIELSDCDRAGWYVGMLADGTTGLYPADHFQPSPVSAQSEA